MASGKLSRRPAVLLALGLCAFGGVVTLLGRLAGGGAVDQKRAQFTAETGTQSCAAFSPDGRQVAYNGQAGSTDDEGSHIFVRPASGGAPRQLTSGSASDTGPVWSPDGSTLAFLRAEEGRAQAMLIPAAGGAPRKVAEFDAADSEDNVTAPSIAWTRDGQSLAVAVAGEDEKHPPAIALLSISSGALRRITNPPEGSQGDANPVISPDGKTLAFVRNTDQDRADIFLTDLTGAHPRAVTFDSHRIRGIAWSAGGQDLIYASDRGSGWRLWRLPAYGGSPREVLTAGNHASFPAVAPEGYRLAFTDSPSVASVWQARLGSPDDPQERQVIRTTSRESSPCWSPDGARIADVSEQSGTPEIWVGDGKGGPRVQVTRLDGPRIHTVRWSPDSATLLFDAYGPGGVGIYTVTAAGGKVTRVLGDAGDPSWSRDGKSIFYTAAGGQIWRAGRDGSHPEQLTHRFGSGSPEQTLDGKWIYYRSRRSIWRMPSGGGKEEEAIVPEHDMMWASMRVVKDGIYYAEFDRGRRGVSLVFNDFATGKNHPALRSRDGDFSGFSISLDGKSVLYAKTDRSQTNLAIVENFR